MNRMNTMLWKASDLMNLSFLIKLKHLVFAPKGIVLLSHRRCMQNLIATCEYLTQLSNEEQADIESLNKPFKIRRALIKLSSVEIKIKRVKANLIHFYGSDERINMAIDNLLNELTEHIDSLESLSIEQELIGTEFKSLELAA